MAKQLINLCYINPDRGQVEDFRNKVVGGVRFMLCDRDPATAIRTILSLGADDRMKIDICELRDSYPNSTETTVEIMAAIRKILPLAKLIVGLEPVIPEKVRVLIANGADGLFHLTEHRPDEMIALYRAVAQGMPSMDRDVWQSMSSAVPEVPTQRWLDVAWVQLNHSALAVKQACEKVPNGELGPDTFNQYLRDWRKAIQHAFTQRYKLPGFTQPGFIGPGGYVFLPYYFRDIAFDRLGCQDPQRGCRDLYRWGGAGSLQRKNWNLLFGDPRQRDELLRAIWY